MTEKNIVTEEAKIYEGLLMKGLLMKASMKSSSFSARFTVKRIRK